MKKIIKNGLVAVMILLNLNSLSASTENLISVEINNRLNSIRQGSKILIKNDKNKVIYTEEIPEGVNSAQEYNLPNLGQGDYMLEIEYDMEIQIRPFRVNAHNVEFFENQAYVVYKPSITTSNKRVHLTRLNLVKEDVLVKVYDQYGALLHTEKFSDQLEMKRIYDFSNFSEDTFSLVVQSDTRTFVKKIKF